MFNEYENYMKAFKMGQPSIHSVRAYENALGRFVEHFGIDSCNALESLTADDMRSYQEELLDSGLGESSVNHHFLIIKIFINWMILNDKISRDPLKGVKKLKQGEKDVAVFFTFEERDAMLNAEKNPNKKLMLAVMFFQGLRREEICEIKVSDFDPINATLLVHGKGSKQVKQENINPYVVGLYNTYMENRKSDSEYLFSTQKMGFAKEKTGWHKITGQTVLNIVRSSARRAGIPEEKIEKVGAHTTRRSCACHLALLGYNDTLIQAHMRHTSILTTMRYTKPVRDMLAAKASCALPVPVIK